MSPTHVVEEILTTSIRWDKYPAMNSQKTYRRKAYLILLVVKEELGIEDLSASEITEIINRKFRGHRTRQSTIINALNKYIGTEVDTRIIRGATRYSLLPAGRKLISGETSDEKRSAPRRALTKEEQHYAKAKECFSNLEIHPEIRRASESLFESGHFAQAIFEAFKKVNNIVKEKCNEVNLDGKSLMLNVFSKNDPKLRFNNLATRSDQDEQEGFMHLYAGAMQGIRNPKGHEEVVQEDPFKTIEYLCFASLLAKRAEECKK